MVQALFGQLHNLFRDRDLAEVTLGIEGVDEWHDVLALILIHFDVLVEQGQFILFAGDGEVTAETGFTQRPIGDGDRKLHLLLLTLVIHINQLIGGPGIQR